MVKNLKYFYYLLKTSESEIEEIINNIDKYYYESAKIKKNKDGLPVIDRHGKQKKRILNPSKGKLKVIQKRINCRILADLTLPSYFYGGVRKKDNIKNARLHQGKKYIFTTDLKNFFPSIRNSHVFRMFMDFGFTPKISMWLTQLTTYKGRLPQGTPTSTLIANLVFVRTGQKLENFCKEHNITFSSFVDDLTFSSPNDFKSNIPELLDLIKSDGYKISHNKTNYKTRDPIVTGVVVKNNNLALTKQVQLKLCDTELSDSQKAGVKNYANRIKSA